MAPLLQLTLAVHALSAGALLIAPQRWPIALGAIVANHLAITWGTVSARSRLLGRNLSRIPGASFGRVGLTFDDGPDPDVTPAVLDVLDLYRAKASFFFIGRKVEAHPEVAALVISRGHTVENHTHTHPNGFAFRGPQGLDREVRQAQEAIVRATGVRPVYFRAPAGIRNLWLDPCLQRAGLSLVSWTRRGFDTVSSDARRVADRLAGAQTGEVLLLHDGNSARDRSGRPVVLEALPRVLDGLAGRSLRAVAIPRPGAES